jgi:hypothetical protein
MPAKMLPPSIPGGQPGAPMPTKPKPKKRLPSKNQMGPKGPGGFGVMPPQQMGGQQMKKGGKAGWGI